MEEDYEDPQKMDTLEFLLKRSMVSRNKQTIIVPDEDGNTVFCCVECPMKYTDKESMELHLCMHNKEYRFICTICGTGLKRREHLERHTLGHQEVRPHICVDCGKGFKRKEHLNIHRQIHSGEKNLQCPLCERSFHRKDHLRKHLHTHNKKYTMQQSEEINYDDRMIEIKEEPLDYDVPVIMNVEGNFVEPEVMLELEDNAVTQPTEMVVGTPFDPERPFACTMCVKTFKRKDHLKLHLATHLRKKKMCTNCGRGFHTEEKLAAHMRFHVKNEDPELNIDPLRLRIVEGDASWKDKMNETLMVPRGDVRPHQCQICHKKFKRKQHLKVHQNVHTKNESSIWCSMCHGGFKTNLEFELHPCPVEPADGNNDTENYDIQNNSVADEAQTENGNMEYDEAPTYMTLTPQILMHEPPPSPPKKNFVCRFCGKPFRRRDHFKIHLNIHTGFKSFFCSECGKGFYRKDHLQKHVPTHFKNKNKPPPVPSHPPTQAFKKEIPELYPINVMKKANFLPEITIHAPSSANLRLPLQMKVPYEVITSTENGEHRAVIHPKKMLQEAIA